MSKDEKEKRRMEDMALMTVDIRNETGNVMKASIPNQYKLEQNYPNPFNPITRITYSIPNTQYTILKVYDILGKEVKTLVNEIKPAGTYSVVFDGSNLASGIYFYKLVVSLSNPISAGDFTQVKRMVLLK